MIATVSAQLDAHPGIRAAITKPPSGSRGLRGGVFLRSRARDCSFSLFITKIVYQISVVPFCHLDIAYSASLSGSSQRNLTSASVVSFGRSSRIQWPVSLEHYDRDVVSDELHLRGKFIA
jgi:hypothetical protein